ncbi:Ankyrin repeat, SAM and basic leucine zipper domain-containing protein 1 [Vulpes lagopus]
MAGMAAGALRSQAVAGGGESSESEDDGWEIGYLDRAVQKLKGPLLPEEKNETFKKALTSGDTSLVKELLDSGETPGMVSTLYTLHTLVRSCKRSSPSPSWKRSGVAFSSGSPRSVERIEGCV